MFFSYLLKMEWFTSNLYARTNKNDKHLKRVKYDSALEVVMLSISGNKSDFRANKGRSLYDVR